MVNTKRALLATMTLLGGSLLLGPLGAQPNVRPGTDVSLGILGDFTSLGRTGSFPNGLNGLAMSTTSCNLGTVNVPWRAPMNEDHPVIAFIAARVTDGRMVQISDRSYVKHGFFALSSSQCTPCENPSDGTFLGVGCSDTYGTGNNGDRFWLGPAEEIDPWQGTWVAQCSHFDRGEPPVDPPFDCDGIRSSINPPNSAAHRVEVTDADLNTPGDFYYAGYYVVLGEPVENRDNNLGSRRFVPTWSGSRWNINVPGAGNPLVHGSILEQWEGAAVYAAGNGKHDGVVYVGVNVTGPDGNGMYHYEYAIHNRGNHRGIASLEIPLCPGATVTNFTFRDIDDTLGNDWSFSVTGTEVTFYTDDNPVEWNTFYNFGFDSDAAPSDGHTALLGEARAGPGPAEFPILLKAPMGPDAAENLGHGKIGGNGLVPEFSICGGLDSGEMADLVLRYAAPDERAYLAFAFTEGCVDIFGGKLIPFPPQFLIAQTDANGMVMFPIPGGGGPVDVYLQFLIEDEGATFEFAFSNALRAHFGL